jgi:hypothetical protein
VSTELERRYRRALGWYPRGWREKNADVVAGTLLDVADAEHRTRPRRGELANLAASGISTRLGVLLEPRARNAISTIALATGVAYPLAYFAFQLWLPGGLIRSPYWHNAAAMGHNAIVNPGLIFLALWALAFLLALTPRRRFLKTAIAAAIVASGVFSLLNQHPSVGPAWFGLTTTTMVFLAALGVLSLIGTPATKLRLILHAVIAFGLILSAYVITGVLPAGGFVDERFFWSNLFGTVMLMLVLAGFVAVALGMARRTALAQTVAISALPWTAALIGYRDLWNLLAFLGIAAALTGFGALLPFAFRRAQSTPAEDKMPLG